MIVGKYFDLNYILTYLQYSLIFSQPLQHQFAKFVIEKSFKTTLMCNDHLDVVQCSIITSCHPDQSRTKIGYGWKHFCKIEQYKSGDTLRFKFGGRHARMLLHVINLNI
jgi:hypothetical protein